MSTWKQTGSVTAYIRQFRAFDQLVRKESLPEHVRVSMFIRGLKSELRKLVSGWQLKTLPEVYQKAPLGLPPRRVVDHRINLKSETTPFNQHSYRMNQVELAALRKQLDGCIGVRYWSLSSARGKRIQTIAPGRIFQQEAK